MTDYICLTHIYRMKYMYHVYLFLFQCFKYNQSCLFGWPILSFLVEEKFSLIDTSTTFRYFIFFSFLFQRLDTQDRVIQSHYETVYIIKNIVD